MRDEVATGTSTAFSFPVVQCQASLLVWAESATAQLDLNPSESTWLGEFFRRLNHTGFDA